MTHILGTNAHTAEPITTVLKRLPAMNVLGAFANSALLNVVPYAVHGALVGTGGVAWHALVADVVVSEDGDGEE
jgi:hypothetical protein